MSQSREEEKKKKKTEDKNVTLGISIGVLKNLQLVVNWDADEQKD